jgi:hypothetical protein
VEDPDRVHHPQGRAEPAAQGPTRDPQPRPLVLP